MKLKHQEQMEHLAKRVELLCISDLNDSVMLLSYGLQRMGQQQKEGGWD